MGNNILQKRGLSACTPVSMSVRSDDKALWWSRFKDKQDIRTDIFACSSDIYHKRTNVYRDSLTY